MAKIFKVDAGYVVADRGGWLPGVYDTERTAWCACTVDIEELEKVAEAAERHGGIIRMIDLNPQAGHAGS